jgi:hypothetical protein
MPALKELLGVSPARERVISDACQVLDQEVGDKGGLSGAAIKAAYAVVKGIKPGFVRDVIDNLLNDFLDALDPLYQQATSEGVPPGQHLVKQSGPSAEALLTITDARAARAERAVIKKTYERLRPSAKKHVEAAMPRVGAMLEQAISRT